MDERKRRRGGPDWHVGGNPNRPNLLRDTRLSVHEETTGMNPRGGMREGFRRLESPHYNDLTCFLMC